MFGLYVRTKLCFLFFVFYFILALFGPGGEYIFDPAIRARFKHANLLASWHIRAWGQMGPRSVVALWHFKVTKKKKKKKKNSHVCSVCQNRVLFFFFYFIFLAPFGPGAEYISVPAIRARFEHADCYQSARLTRGQTGPTATVALWHFKFTKKKKNYSHVLAVCQNRVLFFFFFFFFFIFFWPCLALGQTCRLLAIGMFESGPYSRDPKCTPGGLVGNYKVCIMSFHHDKL